MAFDYLLQLTLKLVRFPEIIGIEKGDPRPGRFRNPSIPRPIGTAMISFNDDEPVVCSGEETQH